MTVADLPTLRCSAWARAAGLDPIGSAGSYRGFLMVETPLPWPRDVAEIPSIASVADVVSGNGLRVQAVLPAGPERRLIAYLRPDGDFSGYTRREVPVAGDLRAAVTAILADGAVTGVPTDSGRDLLVCTHGRRDVCCGSYGTALAATLAGGGSLPAGVRVWRTSHTGGHRFAPTFIVLPEGTAWAYADADLVETVLERRGDAADVADRYRGCAGLTGPAVQALEREVLRRTGWDLLDRPRSGRLEGTVARLDVSRPDGGVDAWTADVTPGRTVPVPDCGRPIEEARKTDTEWTVGNVTRL